MIADPKMVFFHLSIIVISNSLSFVVLNLCPTFFVLKFVKHHVQVTASKRTKKASFHSLKD